MILDALLQFSAAQALTSTGSTASTNVIDLNVARDMGIGEPDVQLYAEVGTTFASGGSATLQVQVQGSSDNSTFYTMAEGPVIAVASLVSGARPLQIDMPRPPAGVAMPRYIRLNYVIGTAAMTAGTINAALVLQRRDVVNYPPGIVVVN